jgi:hypothetical protein
MQLVRVFASSLPRRLSIACAAACLLLGGCSTYEAGTPKTAVNYHGPPWTEKEVGARCLEQVTEDPLPSISHLALPG